MRTHAQKQFPSVRRNAAGLLAAVGLAAFLLALDLRLSPLVAATDGNRFRPLADLPPLLEFIDGRRVETAAAWPERKAELRRLLLQYFTGSPPEVTPAIVDAEVLEERTANDGSTRRRISVTLGTPNRRSFEMWLWLPPGDGPFALLLTAPRDYQIPWADLVLGRGYGVCLYPGVDSHHREAAYPGYESIWETFREEYPQATWTEIITKAWLASRALDYLLDPGRGYPLAVGQVGILGFSRYGKQSMIAAALDERITAVIARSPGSPASCPYRFTSLDTFAEAPTDFPGQWFPPSLRGTPAGRVWDAWCMTFTAPSISWSRGRAVSHRPATAWRRPSSTPNVCICWAIQWAAWWRFMPLPWTNACRAWPVSADCRRCAAATTTPAPPEASCDSGSGMPWRPSWACSKAARRISPTIPMTCCA
jgi:hypothetical protein